LEVPDWYCRNDWQREFFAGIDGGFDTESASTAACEICRKTLSYILTDYGVQQEIDLYDPGLVKVALNGSFC
jgi:hypothetical protein